MARPTLEIELLDAIDGLANLLEKSKPFYMEDVTVKSWILGPGGRTGNCELCIENADEGEIEESEAFPAAGQYGPVDEPPLHDHCECEISYRDTRRRVYV